MVTGACLSPPTYVLIFHNFNRSKKDNNMSERDKIQLNGKFYYCIKDQVTCFTEK